MNLNSLGQLTFWTFKDSQMFHIRTHQGCSSEMKGFFWVKMSLLLKMVPISAEAGIRLTHQPMDQFPPQWTPRAAVEITAPLWPCHLCITWILALQPPFLRQCNIQMGFIWTTLTLKNVLYFHISWPGEAFTINLWVISIRYHIKLFSGGNRAGSLLGYLPSFIFGEWTKCWSQLQYMVPLFSNPRSEVLTGASIKITVFLDETLCS